MTRQLAVILLLLLSCAGCAIPHKEIDNNPPFSAHYFRYHDLDIKWQAERNAGGISITGTVHNVRSYYLQDLELTGRLLNDQGRVVVRETYADFPDYLPPDTSVPFHLEFRLSPGTRAERIHFSYVYLLAEPVPPFRVDEDVPHFGTFVSPL